MIVKANQIELTKELVEKYLEFLEDVDVTSNRGRKRLRRACQSNNEEKIIIDWSGCTVDELELDVFTLSMYYKIQPQYFNNKYILKYLVEKFNDEGSTQFYWDYLVDSGGPLSNSTFCSLTFLEIVTEYLKYKKTEMDDFTSITGLQYEQRETEVFNKINNLLIENDMPELGTSEFNELCSQYFGGSNGN